MQHTLHLKTYNASTKTTLPTTTLTISSPSQSQSQSLPESLISCTALTFNNSTDFTRDYSNLSQQANAVSLIVNCPNESDDKEKKEYAALFSYLQERSKAIKIKENDVTIYLLPPPMLVEGGRKFVWSDQIECLTITATATSSNKRHRDGFLVTSSSSSLTSQTPQPPQPPQNQPLQREDAPSLSLLRETLRLKTHTSFCAINSSYGEMKGTSKTSRCCREEGMENGLQGMFSRILWSQKMREVIESKSELDPIFPSNPSKDDAVLKELLDGGRTVSQSMNVFNDLVKGFYYAAKEVNGRRKDLTGVMIRNERVSISPTPVDGVIDLNEMYALKFTNPSQRYTEEEVTRTILGTHLTKLHSRYTLYTKSVPAADPTFLRRVFCVLCRYETLSGASDGYQMAYPLSGFASLSKCFGCRAEVFASPLNCTFERFCSVAVDTDTFFGSGGSFWKFMGDINTWKPRGLADTNAILSPPADLIVSNEGGSYEANPPFVEEVMEKMASRIIHLLDVHERKGTPLSFIVIVPGWKDDDCKSFQAMKDTVYNRGLTPNYYLVLKKKEHNYRPGMQHRRVMVEQPSNVDTFLFFLQNEEGRKKWPVTEEKIRYCIEAVKNG